MRQIRQQNSGRCPMTDAGWAKKAVDALPMVAGSYSSNARDVSIIKLLIKEHARSLRIVRAKLKAAQYAVEDSGSAVDLAYWDGQEAACRDILTALQRGRGGKG